MATKIMPKLSKGLTEKQDMKMDKRMNIKENSPRDLKKDKALGITPVKPKKMK